VKIPTQPNQIKSHYNFFDARSKNYAKLMGRYQTKYKNMKEHKVLKHYLRKTEGWFLSDRMSDGYLSRPGSVTTRSSRRSTIELKTRTPRQRKRIRYVSNRNYIPEFRTRKRLKLKTSEVRKLVTKQSEMIKASPIIKSKTPHNNQRISYTKSRL